MPDSSTPVEVFYSYAHKDEAFRKQAGDAPEPPATARIDHRMA